MDAKHTPGPWSICYDGQLDGSDGTRVLFLPFDSYKEFNDMPPAFKANLRLIAAAPDMLNALRRAVLALAFSAETSPAMRDDYNAVSAAIAKATGA